MPRKKRSQSRPASKQQALGRSSSIGDLGSRRIRPSGFSYIRIWKVPVGQTGTFRYWKLWKEKKGNKKSWIVFSFFDQRLSLTTISIRSLPKMRVKREFLFIRHRTPGWAVRVFCVNYWEKERKKIMIEKIIIIGNLLLWFPRSYLNVYF